MMSAILDPGSQFYQPEPLAEEILLGTYFMGRDVARRILPQSAADPSPGGPRPEAQSL